MTKNNRVAVPEPKLVDSMFLPNGDQVCIWSDGVATLVNTDKGDEIIGMRKAKRLLSQARGASS
jgi:hypothetical protein